MQNSVKLHINPLYLVLMREYYSEFGITFYSMHLIQGEIEAQTDEILVSEDAVRVIRPLTA